MLKSAEIPLRGVTLAVLCLTGVLLERAVDRYLTPPPAPVVLKVEEDGRINPNSSFEPVYKAWKDLQSPAYIGMDGVSRSFTRVMQEMGHHVGNPETFGSAPRLGKAGRVGLYRRVVPSTSQEFGFVGGVNWGERVSWMAEFPVANPDQSTDIFGLTEKGYVRLSTHLPNGNTEWYIERWPDGSVDFGNGIIGPSTADIKAANRK